MAQIVKWSDTYKTGNVVMDAQHQELVGYINELSRCGTAHHPDIDPIVERIIDFGARHFLYEEELMREASYPQYEEHVNHHNRILASLAGLQYSENLEEDLMRFMVGDWLTEHMMADDFKLTEFLKGRK